MEHRFADVGGVRIHYVEEGSGPLVVLLHGFPEFWYSWRHQIPALARAGFRVIAPDLRGYNDSARPLDVDSYKITAVVQDIAGLIVQSGDVPCAVVGHDWGGLAAWLLPMLHPRLVRKLVVLNSPHPVPYSRELRRNRAQKLRSSYQLFFSMPVLPQLFLPLFLGTLMRRSGRFTSEDIRAYRVAWRKPGAMTTMTNYYRALTRYRKDLRPLIRPIEVPTLLIWGERDPVFTRATTEDFGEYVPDLRVERIAEAGHFVQTDAAERVNELLVGFLSLSVGAGS